MKHVNSLVLVHDVKQQKLWRHLLQRFVRNKLALIGLIAFGILILIAILSPWISGYDPLRQNLRGALQPPSLRHFFGTDQYGRDVYSRLVSGTRLALLEGFATTLCAFLLGTPLGILAAYYSGWVDSIIMRVVDILLSFPSILLALVIIVAIGPGLRSVLIAVSVFFVPTYIRLSRSSTLSVQETEYVMASKAIGGSTLHIMLQHIMPNIILPLIVLSSLEVGGAILFASSLSFLGMGAQPPTPEWGAMLTTGRIYLRNAWWIPIFPGVAIMTTVLIANIVGDGLRDALDPRQMLSRR